MRVRLRHHVLARRLARSRLSQNNWARRLGLSRGYLSDLVNGKRRYPSAAVRRRLLEALDLEFDELFRLEETVAAAKPAVFEMDAGPYRLRLERLTVPASAGEGESRMRALRNFWTDLRYGARKLARQPLHAAAAMASIAIGVGAVCLVFSFVNFFLLRPIPGVPEMDGLVNVRSFATDAEDAGDLFSYPNYLDLREGTTALAELAGFHGLFLNVAGAGVQSSQVGGQLVTDNYFAVLGVEPYQGRFFLPEEHREAGAHSVVVISHSYWQGRLGGGEALGRQLRVNGRPFQIVGIGPPGFRGHFIGFDFELFLPDSMAEVASRSLDDRAGGWVEMVGRLAPGVTLGQAQADLDLQAARLAEGFPDVNRKLRLEVSPNTGVDEDLRKGLAVFLGIFGLIAVLILASACFNVANMILARYLARRRELALRRALGAAGGRIGVQLVTENLLLSVPGAAAGLLLAGAGVAALNGTLSSLGPGVSSRASIDPAAASVALVVALLVGVALGLAAALRTRGGEGLDGSRGASSRNRFASLLVTGQIAICLVLLVTAGLFLRGLGRSLTLDPGFEARGVYLVSADPDQLGMDPEQSRTFYRDLLRAASQAPGVESAALTNRVPLGLGAAFFGNTHPIEIPGLQNPPGEDGFQVENSTVSASYFETLQIPILSGRGFEESDREGSQPVAVINEALALRFWPGEDPVGRTFRLEGRDRTIVGVARTSKVRSIAEPDRPLFYLPIAQQPAAATLLVKSRQEPAKLTADMRALVGQLLPGLAPSEVRPLTEHLESALLPQRVGSTLAGLMGLTALLLSMVGVYGIVAFSVSRRRREIGIRMSLGAPPRDVARLIRGQGLRRAAVGIVLGGLAALGVSRLLEGFLVGVSPADPVAYLTSVAVLVLATLAASWLPARRAARVDPVETLRAE